jgi:hypothetical protein
MGQISIDEVCSKWSIASSLLPKELVELLSFHNELSKEQCFVWDFNFYFEIRGISGPMAWFSPTEEFTNRFYTFASNNAYDRFAIWDDGNHQSLNQMSVMLIGDDGYVGVVAENILQFMQMMAAIPQTPSGRYTYLTDSAILEPVEWYLYESPPPMFEAYRDFLYRHFYALPLSNPTEATRLAFQKNQPLFLQWSKPYRDFEFSF